MSVERVPPRSAYEFSPPLKAWPATSRSPRIRQIPTTDVEVTYSPRRLVIVLAISILTSFLIAFSFTIFLFITFLLFAFFLIAFLLIAFFMLYLHSMDRGLNDVASSQRGLASRRDKLGLTGRKDAALKSLERNRDFRAQGQYGDGWNN